jgi:hypothetical protein
MAGSRAKRGRESGGRLEGWSIEFRWDRTALSGCIEVKPPFRFYASRVLEITAIPICMACIT